MAVRAVSAGGMASLSRFKGALVGAVLGDCVGGEFEGAEEVPMENVLLHLNSLDDDTKGDGEVAHIHYSHSHIVHIQFTFTFSFSNVSHQQKNT